MRERYGRGIAYIEQDYVRRTVFQELDELDGANIDLIGQMARHAAGWYRARDLLERPRETIIDETSSLDATVQQILTETGLGRPAPEVQVGDDDRLTGSE